MYSIRNLYVFEYKKVKYTQIYSHITNLGFKAMHFTDMFINVQCLIIIWLMDLGPQGKQSFK